MADIGLDAILATLLGVQKDAEAESPWLPITDATDLIGKTLIQSSPHFSLQENILAGLLTGAVGGLGKNLTKSYADEQSALASDYMLGGGSVFEKPEGLSESIFQKAKNARSIFEVQDLLNRREAEAASKAAFEQDINKAFLDNPEKATYGVQALAASRGLTNADGTPIALPSNELTPYRKLTGGDETAARALFERDVQSPERLQTMADKFNSLDEVKLFKVADTGYKALMEALKDTSGQSDVEITRRAIQAIEPGLAVRMDDQVAIQNSTSIPSSWLGNMQAALQGETTLRPEVREGLGRIAARSYYQIGEKFNAARALALAKADGAGLDPSQLTSLGEASLPGLYERTGEVAPADYMQRLAGMFGNTPEGRAAFKAAAQQMKAQRVNQYGR